MKKILKLTYILCCTSLFLLTACHDDPDPVKKSRTVLAYIAADNSLSDYATLDIDEMLEGYAAVEADSSNLLVYVDDDSTPRLIQITKDASGAVVEKTIYNYKEQNSLDASVMSEVFERVFDNFPADSYGLVLWSHGDGWIPANPAAPSTRWFGQDAGTYMNISALKTVLETAPHFDFILFDACFMQSVEVVYELRNCADYFISSPTEIPGPGAYYVDVVPAMFQQKDVALAVANGYFNQYSNLFDKDLPEGYVLPSTWKIDDPWLVGVSVSIIKSDKLEALAAATKNVLSQYITSGGITIPTSGILCYDPYRDNYYYDMNGLMKSLSLDAAAYASWKAAFDASVIWAETTDQNYCTYSSGIGKMTSMAGFSGLSIYIPRGTFTSSLNKFYRTYEWYTDGGWSDTGW
ncbi:clostripain-related cysteine peptidase [Bacteroides ihuae]|uniref:clostripain-related cysteine peptidase n=1 Tax=Bacteroides ihuae TaxID=1852362 RepID=UPI0008D8E674|nr:clostripain-related cysteine peptidase [Bacteroides ihuae]